MRECCESIIGEGASSRKLTSDHRNSRAKGDGQIYCLTAFNRASILWGELIGSETRTPPRRCPFESPDLSNESLSGRPRQSAYPALQHENIRTQENVELIFSPSTSLTPV